MNILIIENGWVNYVLGVLWSLSVEEVFYLSFPLAALFFRKQSLIVLFYSRHILDSYITVKKVGLIYTITFPALMALLLAVSLLCLPRS